MDLKNDTKIGDDWLDIIVNSFMSNISSLEQEKLNQWLDSSVDNQKRYDELKEIWDTLSVLEESEKYDYKSAFENFKDRVGEERPKKKRVLYSFLKYASIITILLLGSYFVQLNLTKEPEEKFALNSISVPDGSTSKIEFKDGSRIWMNSNTELELVEPKDKNERRVRLDGEAFLEVKRNEISPFTVETSSAEVKVLGTTFNVNAYADEKELKVTLESGSVEVLTGLGEKIQLSPSEQFVYDINSGTFSVQEIDLKKELAWKTNNLIFTGEPFGEIADLLEKKFKINIEIQNKSLLNTHFSGDFVNNETIEQILDVMSSNNRFRYNKNGNVIRIY